MGSMMTRARRPTPAMSVERIRVKTTRDLLARYAAHGPFVAELEALRDRHRPGGDPLPYPVRWGDVVPIEAAADYTADVTALATRWGLDRLPDDLGRRTIHKWLAVDDAFPRVEFVGRVAKAVPEMVGEIDLPFVWLADEGPEFATWFPHPSLPTVSGSPTQARDQLLGLCKVAIEAELERIARLHEERGFRFPDSRPDRDRHLGWWFMRYALGHAARWIGDNDGTLPVSEQAVRKAISALDADLGVPSNAPAITTPTHITVDHTGTVVE